MSWAGESDDSDGGGGVGWIDGVAGSGGWEWEAVIGEGKGCRVHRALVRVFWWEHSNRW